VATNGGLPFLGVGVMRSGELRALLTETKLKMGDLPWGVGILGFLPPELWREQTEAICEIGPRFAVIAGGHPGQAAELEIHDISTYLHVPSPGLLEIFIKDGARKFIFEGREGGGHVGPLTSFTLWESAVQNLLEADIDDSEKVQILFAGGIHDGLSAAMVATLAAPLTSRGMKIGVLMGTAYLFTKEAVTTGAITPEYQTQAILCKETALLESAPGYATRCAKTPFVNDFKDKKQEMIRAEKKGDEIRRELEILNVGRLRIAAKGITRHPNVQTTDECDKFIRLDRKAQRCEGLFMMGQVAALREATLSVTDLHAELSGGAEKHLAALAAPPKETKTIEKEDIAIVGMASMFPEASNLKEYYQNIVNRVDAIREVKDERWRAADFFDPDPQTPDKTYSKWGGFLKDIQFDPTKYGIPPASLSCIEPMQLLALEVAWQALEDAGYNQYEFPRERTSCIFAVAQMHDLGIDYLFRTMLIHYLPKVEGLPTKTRQEIIDSLHSKLPKWTGDSFPGFLGNIVAGRVANRLDLGGSNFTVDAACASSLAAMEVAIKQLQAGICDVALVGAIDGTNHAFAYLAFSKTYALSPHGRACPFDDNADGTVISEGAAVIVLKRLSDAERDGDNIYAVIKGIGSSSDGRNRSLIAPHPGGVVVSALHRAYKDADISPNTVELIEAHGTGTFLGDKVEVESLSEVFTDTGSILQYCAIGSVKSMIGHCKAAAGMAGLIKTILSLKHKILPPTIGVKTPNSRVNFSLTPFYINSEPRPWLDSRNGHPRRAGVSALGFGGTNFHVVLEEYTAGYRESSCLDISPREAEIFSWTRASRAEIQDIIKHISSELEKTEITDLAQAAYSVFLDEEEIRRRGSKQDIRLDIVATSITDLKEKLKIALSEISAKGSINMPQGVYYSEDTASATHGVCFLFPGQGSQAVNMLRDLVLSIPQAYSIFGLADELLRDCLERPLSRYIYPLPVFSDSECNKQQAELNETHIAQPALAVVNLVAYDLLKTYGIEAEFMAGHSFGEYVALCAAGAISRKDLISLAAMVGKKLAAELKKTDFHKPWCKVYSDTTANPYPDSPEDIRALLVRHISEPVQFERQIRQMFKAGARIFIEVGPGRILANMVERILSNKTHTVLSLDAKGRSGWLQLGHLLAQTRNLGLSVNLKSWFKNRRLATISTDEVFKGAEAYANPSPIIWRVNGGKASPWHQTAEPSRPVRSPIEHPQDASIAAPIIAQLQTNMAQILELQREQQRTTERLVTLQEQVMSAYLEERKVTPPGRPLKRVASLKGVPLVPVIPRLSVQPSGSKVALIPSNPPKTGPREVTTGQPSTIYAVPMASDASVSKEIPPTEEFQVSLLRVVSERTGYPIEMLKLDLDLERDLGIDSIKLVEIISALSNYHNLLQATDEAKIMNKFTALKTLRSIVEWYDKSRLRIMTGGIPSSGQDATFNPVLSQPASTEEANDLSVDPVQRLIPKSVPAIPNSPSEASAFPMDHIILLVGETPGMIVELYGGLAAQSYRVRQIIPGRRTGILKNNRFEVDFSSQKSVEELRALIGKSEDIIGGIFNLTGVMDGDFDAVRHLFLLIKVFEADLRESARIGGGLLVNFSGMNGHFGLQGRHSFPVGQAGCVGLLKAVAREWPEVRVKCIDIDPNADPQILSIKIWQELTVFDGIIEVGLDQQGRWKIDLQKDGPEIEDLSPLPINPQSVILVTGGAYGITAEAVKALAAKYRPHLVIVGRTPLSEEESPQTRVLQDPQSLREHLIQELRQEDPKITPVAIEKHLQKILKERQIRGNLVAMKESGAQVEYHALDVRDRKLFSNLLDDIYARWGRIDGVVHGAGVIEDKLIRDKTPDSFSRVFSTKVTPAEVLAERLQPDTLKFLVFFSSIAGRFGNVGQSDYSAANEVLNKLACRLNNEWPSRVISINWGPWDSGMVSDELRKLYLSKGIGLIPVEEGVRFFMEELHRNTHNAPEVVVTRSLKQISQPLLVKSIV